MGRQWRHAKRLVAGLKKGKTNTKLVREITLAAKIGGPDPAMNARLFAALEKEKKRASPKMPSSAPSTRAPVSAKTS
jgi:transcriptional/translational regulatory protein YebC/TACO1